MILKIRYLLTSLTDQKSTFLDSGNNKILIAAQALSWSVQWEAVGWGYLSNSDGSAGDNPIELRLWSAGAM